VVEYKLWLHEDPIFSTHILKKTAKPRPKRQFRKVILHPILILLHRNHRYPLLKRSQSRQPNTTIRYHQTRNIRRAITVRGCSAPRIFTNLLPGPASEIILSAMAMGHTETFELYVREIETFVQRLINDPNSYTKRSSIKPILDGQPAARLRDAIPLAARRDGGTFFTGSRLARQLVNQILREVPSDALIADTGCGAGDLLLASARKLPLAANLPETLRLWSSRLMGFDIRPEFVRATKARLTLLAIDRGLRFCTKNIPKATDWFHMVRRQDFLSCPDAIADASHIVINPPYTQMTAPANCTWANNKVSAAAVFTDACVSHASPGTQVAAILPDVLRSGSNYEKWRNHIESQSQNLRITTYGQFDKWTDIHVFLLTLSKSKTPNTHKTLWWKSVKHPKDGKVGDYFDVHVGAVVPHRHAHKGPSMAYLHAKPLPRWATVKRITERRRFNGTLFQPPFVAVRRTSRPGDNRAVATIILGKRQVAVENHLIVFLPKNNKLSECKNLLRTLKSPKTDQWLNNRIRCRHLTVESLKDLPWWRLTK